MPEKAAAIFWTRVKKLKNGCWQWMGAKHNGGYGASRWHGKPCPAHRVAWMITNGSIPEGMKPMQACNNTGCCNPAHMKLSTMGEFRRLDRFWERVDKKKNGCWEWMGKRNPLGYGFVLVHYRPKRAHRFSWEIHNGPIPKGVFVCHKCDNPPCVNPDHLFLGTPKDNIQDCVKKGRFNKPKGEDHPHAVLTDIKVRNIRDLRKAGATHREIATLIGCSCGAISAVLHRRVWRHVK